MRVKRDKTETHLRTRKAKHPQRIKQFLDMISTGTLSFEKDCYRMDNTCRCVWALRDYPAGTEETALLHSLGEMAGVTVHIYIRTVSGYDERRILANADKINKMRRASTENLQDVVEAESNLQDVTAVIAQAHRNREPFFHCAVYIELMASNAEELTRMQDRVLAELAAAKLNADRLILRQKQGLLCVMPGGQNVFGTEFERVLPASSVANLYPLSYSGKSDSHGFFIGRDKYGSNIIVDFERRDVDKTNANILILGNSGMGKSYLLRLLLCCLLESGKSVLLMDAEGEYREITKALGGCYLDMMTGDYKINVLQPRRWTTEVQIEPNTPEAFRRSTILSQHIAYLRDFFRIYAGDSLQGVHINVLEILLEQLYAKCGISDQTNFENLCPTDYPTLSDLYALMDEQVQQYDNLQNPLYPLDILKELRLALKSLCVGADSAFFNGHTNVTSDRIVTFGLKEVLETDSRIRDAMLFNVLSYMNGELLQRGNAVAAIDELYLFLSNPIAIEYIRNAMKRVRKRDSLMLLASQNIEDFLRPEVAMLTKPLFSIPTHQFLFNPGSIPKAEYADALQLEDAEYALIAACGRGSCLYKCGGERYNLQVIASPHKAALFGKAGGR